MADWLLPVIIFLAVITVVGHLIWITLAWIVRNLLGEPPRSARQADLDPRYLVETSHVQDPRFFADHCRASSRLRHVAHRPFTADTHAEK